MENVLVPWRRCPSCRNGRVALFTSVAICEVCQGTGIDLSDPRLAQPLESLPLQVRTFKYLRKLGVNTLGQLVCFAVNGRMPECEVGGSTIVPDARKLLLRSGLPVGPDVADSTEVDSHRRDGG
jgi:hypothetical protein